MNKNKKKSAHEPLPCLAANRDKRSKNKIVLTHLPNWRTIMEIGATVRDRIFAAADALYEEAGRLAFPTVDAVRKTAKVNMNDASTGMKAWRRGQTARVTAVPVQVPDAIQQTSSATLAALWTEAVNLANESLHSAQAGWDAERAEAETMREQLASAYEVQAKELASAQARMAELSIDAERARGEAASIKIRCDDAQRAVDIATATAKQAEIKAIEVERRANELRQELDHAHELFAEFVREQKSVRHSHDREMDAMRTEMARARDKAELEANKVQVALCAALESAAMLRGQLEAMGRSRHIRRIATRPKPDDGKSRH